MKKLMIFLLFFHQCAAVLPPDQRGPLLCPPKTCLKRKNITIFGPRRSNHVCVNARGDVTKPISPPPTHNLVIEKLRDGGFHSDACAALRGINGL